MKLRRAGAWVCMAALAVAGCEADKADKTEMVEPAPPTDNVGTMMDMQPASWGTEPLLRPSPWQWLRVWYAYYLLPIPEPHAEGAPPAAASGAALGTPPSDGFDHSALGKDTNCRDCHEVADESADNPAGPPAH